MELTELMRSPSRKGRNKTEKKIRIFFGGLGGFASVAFDCLRGFVFITYAVENQLLTRF